jgi:pimeloyl-ACP methyl ester carboxylesterase
MSLIEVAGHRLEYEWIGSPPATEWPTLVFLHEGLGSVGLWRDFPEGLCRRTKSAGLVYSRRGHGTSDPLDGPRTVRFMHEEALVVLPALLDAFRIRRPILIGHSDGGSIAVISEGSGIVRTAGLILEAPHVFVEDMTVESIARTKTRYENGDLRSRLWRHHRGGVDSLFQSWADVWLSPQFRSWNIEEYLPGVVAPTLILQGRDDEYGTEKQVETIASALGSRCETVMLARCGHAPHVDQRATVEAAMAGFIARVLARERTAVRP